MQEINGIIIIDKPKGYTSHDVVAKAKKILNVKKVGHTGTLDPNATGVLPLLINKGTKFSKYLINHDKEYIVKLKLGIKTDTLDGEGKIIQEQKVDISKIDNIESKIKEFIGKQNQIPPMYSAIKVKGKKLYEYARKGEKVEIQPRQIEIYTIDLIKIYEKENEIDFKVSCSKGTYIRTLCESIAEKLGTIGYMKELKRTKVGNFYIENSIKIDELEEKTKQDISNYIITIEDLLCDKEKIVLKNNELEKFLNGVKIEKDLKEDIYIIYNENEEYLGTGIVKDKYLKRDIIL